MRCHPYLCYPLPPPFRLPLVWHLVVDIFQVPPLTTNTNGPLFFCTRSNVSFVNCFLLSVHLGFRVGLRLVTFRFHPLRSFTALGRRTGLLDDYVQIAGIVSHSCRSGSRSRCARCKNRFALVMNASAFQTRLNNYSIFWWVLSGKLDKVFSYSALSLFYSKRPMVAYSLIALARQPVADERVTPLTRAQQFWTASGCVFSLNSMSTSLFNVDAEVLGKRSITWAKVQNYA